MKNFGPLLIAMILLFSSCEKEVNHSNIDKWIKGLWVNDEGDSLCFDSWLIINNSLPYDYLISLDSLYTHRSWSSSLFDGITYSIEVSDSPDELRIFNFLDKPETTFVKLRNSCTW
jgi:hypothetical protein